MKTSAIMVMSFTSALCLIWVGMPPAHAASPPLMQLPAADPRSIILAQDKGGGDKTGKLMTPGAAPGMQPGSTMMEKGDKGGGKEGGGKKGSVMAPGMQPGSMMMEKGDKKGGGKEGGGKKGSVMAPGMQPGSMMMEKGDKKGGGKEGGDKKGSVMAPGEGMQQRMGPGSAGQLPQSQQQMGR